MRELRDRLEVLSTRDFVSVIIFNRIILLCKKRLQNGNLGFPVTQLVKNPPAMQETWV